MFKRSCSLVAGLATLMLASAGVAKELPTHPDLVTGTLPNGLQYVVLEHDNPPDRASMWMHVSTGSMNETDAQRGIAHFLEHMAFNGSENFEKNDVLSFFESMGLTFGRHQNAMTTFDQTIYILDLPDNKPETIANGFVFFSDVASRLTLTTEAIDGERGVILEEKRARLSPQQRVQEYLFERLAPGSRFGQRLPIGTEETIRTMDRDDFVAYYEQWYAPSNITLIVVADQDPATVVELIEKHYSFGERVPRPVDADAGVAPYETSRAIVATDDELQQASVSIMRLEEAVPPTTTEQLARNELVERLGIQAFNRRLDRKVKESAVRFLSGGAEAADLFSAFRLVAVQAEGDPAAWRDMLADLATELQRARLHGFSTQELADVRAELTAGLERAVEIESTLPARAFLAQLNQSVAEGEPFMSATQQRELAEPLLATISDEEISARFTELFDPAAVAFVATLPASAGAPTKDELMSLGAAALAVQPDADVETARVAELLAQLPDPGTVSDITVHDDTNVSSAWLSNGVRLHHRFMDYREDTATITISLAGGPLLESAGNHGITSLATLAWTQPATSTLSSTQIRDLMTGKKVNVAGGPGQDAIVLRVSGSPAELETGMQLAHLLLTDPMIEDAAVAQFKERQRQMIAMRKQQPGGVAIEAFTEMILPEGEVRLRQLEQDELDRLERSAAQQWLESLLRESPIEVSIVGDIDRDAAFELVARYVGSVPARPRISTDTHASLRAIARPAGPMAESRDVVTQTPQAIVQAGFFGADWNDVDDRRRLSMAGRILSTRMIKQLREEQQLVYSIGAQSVPGMAYPGYGMVIAGAPTEPGKADTLAAAIDAMYAEFALNGPTEEEMDVARKQVANQLDEQMKEPGFWTFYLTDLTYRGSSLDDVMSSPAAHEGYTADSVRETFAKYYRDDAKFSVVVKPLVADG